MFHLLCVLCVTIVLLCKVSETKGEPTRAFLTNKTFSWSDAIGKCRPSLSISRLNVDDTYGNIGNCLFVNTSNSNDFKAKKCSTKFHHICLNSNEAGFSLESTPKSNWKDAFGYCKNLASYSSVRGKINTINVLGSFWLSNTRRWTRKREFLDAAEYPEFCVAARIRQNGDVKRFIHRCSQRLPGLCIEVGKTASDTPSKMSSTLSPVNTFSRRLDKTSTFLRSNTLQGITISTYSASQKSTFLSQLGSTSPALKETTGRSKMVPETTSPSQDIQENTFPVLVESPSSDVPGKDEIDVVSEIVIIAIVAATILIVIVISVTVVFCKRKRNTQGTPLNQPMAILGREAVYAEANTPPAQHAGSTSQRFHPTASDDTYDHIDHCRPNQTHNPTESNYDTMRSTGTRSERRNELNYDHATGTKKESNI